jgi:hypothetical protein
MEFKRDSGQQVQKRAGTILQINSSMLGLTHVTQSLVM